MTSTDPEDEALPELRSLRLDRAPQRDLWPGIEARIAPRRRTAWRPWLGYAMAASVVGAITVGLLREAPPPRVATLAERPAVAGQVSPQQQALLKANLAIVKDAENQLRHALEQDPESESLRRLLGSMQQQRGQLGSRLKRVAHVQET